MTLFQPMTDDPQQPPPPTYYVPARATAVQPVRIPRREPVVSWVPTLVVACLALGFSWQMVREVAQGFKEEEHVANGYYSQLSIAEGFQEDIGKLVADPKTTTFTLFGSASSSVRRAVTIWNSNRQTGILFCDQLPVLSNNREYEIWATSKDGSTIQLGHFTARPGVSVYSYDAAFAGEPLHIEVSAGHRLTGNSPILSSMNETQSSSVGG